MNLSKGYILFCAPNDPDMVEAAKNYARSTGLTGDDISIVPGVYEMDGQYDRLVLVTTKREIEWPCAS